MDGSLGFSGRVLGEPAIFLRRHLRQSLHERDDVPDLVVVMNLAVGGHSAHFDAILDDPEYLTGRHIAHCIGQVWRLGIQPFGDIAWIASGGTMTMHASLIVNRKSRACLLIAELCRRLNGLGAANYGMNHCVG